jgi:phage-related protein
MKWRVMFYSEKVENKTLSFPKGILAKLLHVMEMIEEFGPAPGMSYTTPLGGGLFEIRAKGEEGIGRSLSCAVKGKEIIVLHSFVKKSRKIPKKELDLARNRMKEVKR